MSIEEIQQRLSWATALDWTTMQGLSAANLPAGVQNVAEEIVTLIPTMAARYALFMYCQVGITGTPMQPVTSQLNIMGQNWTVGVAANQSLLLEMLVPSLSLDPGPASASAFVREAKMSSVADGTSNQNNVVRGTARSGTVGNFNGDIYSKLAQQADPTRKAKIMGQAQAKYNAEMVTGAQYLQKQVRITDSSWAAPFDNTKFYVIARREQPIAVTAPAAFTGGPVYLYLPDSPDELTIPAYSKPYVDTGDPAIRVVHVYAQLTQQALQFVAQPNLLSQVYCEIEDASAQRLTWMGSIIFSTSTDALFQTLADWQPYISCTAAYSPRCVAYVGLSGNRILMQGGGESDVPPTIQGILYYSLDYPTLEQPAEIVDRINAMNDPKDKESERRVSTNQFMPIAIVDELAPPDTKDRKRKRD